MLRICIDESDPVFKMAEILDTLDYRKLRSSYRRHWRKIEPELLFSVIVYANMQGIFSSRGIEGACKTDIRFIWLLQYHKASAHTTIARFLENSMSSCAEDLFYQLNEKRAEMGELKYENLFVDVTKLEANANRYTFVWAKAVEKNRKKLNEKLEKELPKIKEKYYLDPSLDIKEVVTRLRELAKLQGIRFVYGKGKRKTELQRDHDRLFEYLKKEAKYLEKLSICGKRKSFSKTDPDATFMRLKEDHMLNGQLLKHAYNLQIGVESEYITGLGLFPNPTDTTTLIPFLERVENGCGKRHENTIADAGYASQENYTYLEEKGQNAYIKPADYEQKKTRGFKKNIFHKDNLPYDAERDCFTCPNGKKINFKIELSKIMRRQKEEATERITTHKGILLRMNRSVQVEGAFGVIKQNYGFRPSLPEESRIMKRDCLSSQWLLTYKSCATG